MCIHTTSKCASHRTANGGDAAAPTPTVLPIDHCDATPPLSSDDDMCEPGSTCVPSPTTRVAGDGVCAPHTLVINEQQQQHCVTSDDTLGILTTTATTKDADVPALDVPCNAQHASGASRDDDDGQQQEKHNQHAVDNIQQAHDHTPPADTGHAVEAPLRTRGTTPAVDTPEIAPTTGTVVTSTIVSAKTTNNTEAALNKDAQRAAAKTTALVVVEEEEDAPWPAVPEQDDDMQALEALMQLRTTPPAPSPMPGCMAAPPRGPTKAHMPPPPPPTNPMMQPYGMMCKQRVHAQSVHTIHVHAPHMHS